MTPRTIHNKAALFYGTRADYTRIYSLARLIRKHCLPIQLVNTSQHWDAQLMRAGLGRVDDEDLQTHTSDIATISSAAQKFLAENDYSFIVVYGDTASTLGPSLAAQKLGIPIVHLEAGFRAYDSRGSRMATTMPEESIRIFVDSIADVNIPLLRSNWAQLTQEKQQGLVRGLITEPVGHPLADGIVANAAKYDRIHPEEYFGVVTIHRKSNVEGSIGSGAIEIIKQLSTGRARHMQWLFPAHPATRRIIEDANFKMPQNVEICDPLSRDDMIAAILRASVVVSDSNGVQVEASLIGRPVVVPRPELCYLDLVDRCILVTPDQVGQAVGDALTMELSAEGLVRLRNEFGGGQPTASLKMFEILQRLTTQVPGGHAQTLLRA